VPRNIFSRSCQLSLDRSVWQAQNSGRLQDREPHQNAQLKCSPQVGDNRTAHFCRRALSSKLRHCSSELGRVCPRVSPKPSIFSPLPSAHAKAKRTEKKTASGVTEPPSFRELRTGGRRHPCRNHAWGFGLHFKGPFAAAQLQNARRLPKGDGVGEARFNSHCEPCPAVCKVHCWSSGKIWVWAGPGSCAQ
jgi:hypothetical protein